jgi:hypothetical protein
MGVGRVATSSCSLPESRSVASSWPGAAVTEAREGLAASEAAWGCGANPLRLDRKETTSFRPARGDAAETADMATWVDMGRTRDPVEREAPP